MSEEATSIEQMTEELKVAGWVKVMGHVWKSPNRGYFHGPAGAWKAMKRWEAGAMGQRVVLEEKA